MISKNKKGKLSYLKYSIGVFVALAITLMFACENKIKENTPPPPPPVNNQVTNFDTIKSEAQSNSVTKEPVFIIVEKAASFQDGDLNSFRDWVQKNLEYPEEAAEKGISGKVYVQFAVTSKGDVVDIKILRGCDPSLDKESMRVIKSSPKWTPAQQGGKNVKQQFVIPLNFVLQ